MKILGVTGGIGSGKSTVCKFFSTLDIPVFTADEVAKSLYDTDDQLRKDVIAVFGEDVYQEGRLNREALARKVFSDAHKLAALNNPVHPRVGEAFQRWVGEQNAPYVIREAAILIESGSHKDCDAILLVSAPVDVRVARVTARDNSDEEAVKARMNRQWTDEQRRPYADFEVINDNRRLLIPNLESIDTRMRQS